MVTALIDTLLPTTDTPGGLDVNADMFIDLVIDRTYDEAAKQQKVDEMNAFNAACVDRFGRPFDRLDTEQKHAVLEDEESSAPTFNGSVWGTAVGEQEPVGFYRSFKSMALWAYFSSEEVGKNVLNYDPIPGEYKGCIPLSDVGRVWTL